MAGSSGKGRDGDDTDSDVAPLKLPEIPPIRHRDGSVNIEYFRVKSQRITLIGEHWLARTGKPVNIESQVKALRQEAKLHKVDLDDMTDTRSPAQRVEDAVNRLLTGDNDALLEETDEVLRLMERSMDAADEKCGALIEQTRETVDAQAIEARAAMRRGKVCRSLIERAIRLRLRARNAVVPGVHRPLHPAHKAAHPLRYMIFVFRSDLAKEGASAADRILRIGDHHAKMALRYWAAFNAMRYTVKGHPLEVAQYPWLFTRDGGWQSFPGEEGGLLVMLVPPRHGKSMFGQAAMALAINQNHRIQCALTHANDKHASKNMRQVANCFKGTGHRDENAMGRRNLSLFPARLSRRDNNASCLRLDNDNPPRDPTLTGAGIRTAIGGSNLDYLWGDDIVDQAEARQENQREITAKNFKTQWMRRMQGKMPFVFITATLWHRDDAVGQLVQLITNGQIPGHVCRIPAGGPREKVVGTQTIRPWQPVWPEMISEKALRHAFSQMTPYEYSCQYECDPISDSDRVVKKLRMFCASIAVGEEDVPEWAHRQATQHRTFLHTAERHYSIDPAATSDDKARKGRYKADKAAAVYAACGRILDVTTQDGGVRVSESRSVCRIIGATTFYASPVDAAARFGEFAGANRIDKVHLETTGSGLATTELIVNTHKLPSSAVIRHSPSASKKARLRDVAVMLDDQAVELGLPGACVEFAASWVGGKLVLHEELKWLWDQILNFGFVEDEHGVDATTQMLKFLAPGMRIGGVVSDAVVSARESFETGPMSQSNRIKSVLDQYNNPPTDPWTDDLRLFGRAVAEVGEW